jgi:DNA transformation protein and related proteins
VSISPADIAFAEELFEGLGPLTRRKMMGGLCLYRDGTIFAILHGDGSIWQKGAGTFANQLIAEGWERWTYSRDGRKVTAMPYWRLPPRLLDDPEEACLWARQALAAL